MNQVGKLLIIFGVVLIVVGVLLTVAGKFPFLDKIGRLPGDIIIRREHFTFYFPWVTCLLISLVFFILFNLFRR
ncbi:MAG TPA: DUF2905 domain-containing protein [Candidatus Marinimicrobia bacterium]|nr:DUF2905 domain-containing protein [Candidatus Neomarinimicrobiota bacterium]HPN73738.1 DUF2905 domain-containing protein [Candidatus Neomarinimicrobiota bacterium]HQC62703.1 DUF2905 domain-containing protein [Candidatus Neomarinimicrobiota bacterium]HQH55010.1 DUF2905 domain-containing protein [Candidatus Neomarinimicrobiota bacterium]